MTDADSDAFDQYRADVPTTPEPLDEWRFVTVARALGPVIATLRPGDKMPSLRVVARQNGVSLATAEAAFRRLEADGLIEARPRSGFFVCGRTHTLAPRVARRTALALRPSVAERVRALIEAMRHPEVVALGGAVLGQTLVPVQALSRSMARVAKTAGAIGLAYDVPPGPLALRRQIARRMTEAGAAVEADELLITVGCMEALQLGLAILTRPSDTVVVESPCYYGLLQAAEALDLKVVEVPAHPSTGMDLDALEAVLGQQPVACVMVTPSFLNPLGALMPEAHRKRFVSLIERYKTYAIEDDIYGDLAHDPGLRPRPLKAHDRQGRVLYASSYSKSVAPGYRIGWLHPAGFMDKALTRQFAHIVATPTPTALAMADYLEGGGFERHVRRTRPLIASQVAQYRDVLCRNFPAGTRISEPQGGFVLWLELPAPAGSDITLQRLALERRIAIAPGSIFSARERFGNAIRINCGAPLDDRIERALRTLGELALDVCR